MLPLAPVADGLVAAPPDVPVGLVDDVLPVAVLPVDVLPLDADEPDPIEALVRMKSLELDELVLPLVPVAPEVALDEPR